MAVVQEGIQLNVIGEDGIVGFAREIARLAHRPAVRDWLMRVVPRHVRRTAACCVPIVLSGEIARELGRKPKKELLAKLEGLHRDGVPLHRFDPQSDAADDIQEEARGIVDWLDSVPEWDRHLKRIERMSYADAASMSASWHARLMQLAENADDPDVVEELEILERLADGCRLVLLNGPVALLREGALMGHCVGGRGYVESVRSGQCRIVSLRDADNKPHATIEIRQRKALQIKGKGNAPPVERWAALLRPFIKKANLAVGRDGEAIGLVTVAGRTCDHPDEVVAHLLADGCLAPDSGLRLRDACPPAALSFLRGRSADLGRESRLAVYRATRPVASSIGGGSSVLLTGPGGISVERRDHVVPYACVEALAGGLVAGLEDLVAADMAVLFDALEARMRAAPGHVHVVAMGRDARTVEQMAAFCGRAAQFAALRRDLAAARSSRCGEIAVAIRRATAARSVARDGDGSWAQAWNRLQGMTRDGFQSALGEIPTGLVV